jgi:tetratricopeptide (TPR) repeat protein
MPPPKPPPVISGPLQGLVGPLSAGQAGHALPLRLGPLAGLQSALAPPSQGSKAAPVMPPRTAGALWQSALTCEAIGDVPGAITALREGLRAEPAMGEAWRRLVTLLKYMGDRAGAAQASASLARLSSEDAARTWPAPSSGGKPKAREKELRARLQNLAPDVGELTLRDALRGDPSDAAALRLLAEMKLEQGSPLAAQRMLERAVELSPLYDAARHALALCLLQQSKPGPALGHLEALLAQEPHSVAYRTLLALARSMVGDYARSIELYQGLLRDVPKNADLWLSYGNTLKVAGRRDDSLRALRQCLALAPETGLAHWSMQELSSARGDAADIDALRGLVARAGLSAEARFYLHYALANALEKTGDYAGSFANYEAGARSWRANIRYNPDDTTRDVRANIAYFSVSRIAAHGGAGCPDPAPIFIVGMPRAGSTLIEQILASHPEVEGTQELPELGHILHEMRVGRAGGAAAGYPSFLDLYDAGELAAFGARYIERTRIYRKTAKPFFIDKMPANWMRTGLIHFILPNAKIIDARRNPMATCLGAFKKLFNYGQNFTYDLGELGRYYNDYAALMAHFDNVLPGRVHRATYETIVTDTEAEIRRLLAYCGLDFQPSCLRFWETARAVATASSQQVRQPIFREGLDRWRNFEPWLGQLKEAVLF